MLTSEQVESLLRKLPYLRRGTYAIVVDSEEGAMDTFYQFCYDMEACGYRPELLEWRLVSYSDVQFIFLSRRREDILEQIAGHELRGYVILGPPDVRAHEVKELLEWRLR
jgi:hypothetical protein